MKTITVQGVSVDVKAPYEAGHTITDAEAKALNQVRAENVRNNTAKAVKELLDAANGDVAAVQTKAQELVAAYDAAYEFTLASVGGGRKPADPLEKAARDIARDWIVGKIKDAGMTQKEYLEKNGEDSIKAKIEELSGHPKIIEAAKKALAQRQKMADSLAELG